VNVFLERWDLAKNLPVPFRSQEARKVLQPVALWLHEKDGRRSAPLGDILEIIKKPIDKMGKTEVDPQKLLLNIRDRSGIFMGYNETEYGFTHLSFQAYLAAEEIRNNNGIDVLIKNYANTWWREVILLCLALDNPSIMDAFIEKIVFTKEFETDAGVVTDAIKDSVSKPFDILTGLLKNKNLSPKAADQIRRILHHFGKIEFIQFVERTPESTVIGIKPKIADKILHEKDNSAMVLIPAGSFLYGSKDDDKNANSDEKPQLLIELPAFYMDVYPTTNEQYCRFLNESQPDSEKLTLWINLQGSYSKEKCRIIKNRNGYSIEKGFEQYPVIFVSWYGAKAYSDWAGKRLPSAHQWEKAARGTDGLKYPWGNEFKKEYCNSNENGLGHTTEVTTYKQGKSPYGCYDMAGNVWEWTRTNFNTGVEQEDFIRDKEVEDLDNKKEYYKAWEMANKKGLTAEVRGGAWNLVSGLCRCACRFNAHPYFRDGNLGFRCSRI
jgi:formylglycine-generating enzyme required for sulfatase activity